MHLIFFSITIIGAIYFGLKKRNFDLFSMAFLGCVLYFSPGYFAYASYHIRGVWSITDLDPSTYGVMSLVMSGIIAAAAMSDRIYRHQPCRQLESRSSAELILLSIVAIFGLFAMLITSGNAVFSESKQDMLDGLNRWYVVYIFCAQVGFCLSALAKRPVWFSLFAAMLLFDLYVGFRVGIAIALGGVIVWTLHSRGPTRALVDQKRVVLFAVIGVLAVIAAKGYVGLIKAGHWDFIVSDRMNLEAFLLPILQNESFIVASSLNAILVNDFSSGMDDYFFRAFLAIIPFGNLIDDGVSDFDFQRHLFSSVEYGMASTIWGEAWAVGGWLFLILIVTFYCAAIAIANRFVFLAKTPIKATLILAASYWCLYIHRNSMEYQIVLEKRVLAVAVLLLLFRVVTRKSAFSSRRGDMHLDVSAVDAPAPRSGRECA